jgi:hypothetical protein
MVAFSVLCVFVFVFSLTHLGVSSQNIESTSRIADHGNLSRLHAKKGHMKNQMKQGTIGVIPKYSIHGAVIMSDRGAQNSHETAEEEKKKQLLISARLQNVHKLMSELPFQLTEWAGVFTGPCPLYPNGHKTERGLIWAHYRIILEFLYFDPVILNQINYVEGKAVAEMNQTIVSEDRVYVVYQNGSMYKDGIPFLDDDILVIFEDDAESAILELNTTLIEEFSMMSTDLLYLGWCEGRTARPVPLCAHAYSMTRRGARKLQKVLEPCGRALDEQLVIFAKNNFVSWRRAYAHSFKNLNEKYKNKYGEKTYGIFHQNKDLGSINGHRLRR